SAFHRYVVRKTGSRGNECHASPPTGSLSFATSIPGCVLPSNTRGKNPYALIGPVRGAESHHRPYRDPEQLQQHALLDHLISAGEQRRRHAQPYCPGRFKIDHELELGRRLSWKFGGLFALQNAINIRS